jgi:hypothetical protein
MFFGEIDTILSASTIEAIESLVGGTCELVEPSTRSVNVIPLTSPRALGTAAIARLTRALLDPHSWSFARKRCLPRRTAVLRLQGPKGNVKVEIDAFCSGWVLSASNERRGGFFDPVRTQIIEMLKSAFPEYASTNPRSLWRSGIIHELKCKSQSLNAPRASS